MQNRKVVLFIAASLDGYIATKDDDISWLSLVEKEGEDYGYADFVKTVDTVIIGRKTYDKVLTLSDQFWHAGKKCFVLSKTKTGHDENVSFYNGNISELIASIQTSEGLDIFCDGGSEIIFELMQHGLVDKFIVSIIPVLLGDGIPLFKAGFGLQHLLFLSSTTFPTGLVQLRYEKKQ